MSKPLPSDTLRPNPNSVKVLTAKTTSSKTGVVLGDNLVWNPSVLCAILALQRDAEISDEAIANSSSKIVLSVDQTEVSRVAKRFRFAESLVSQLQPLEALVRMGSEGHKCRIKPFYERLT